MVYKLFSDNIINGANLSGEQAAGAGWIGGSDRKPKESGNGSQAHIDRVVFWNGAVTVLLQAFRYGILMNQSGNEDYAHFYSSWSWPIRVLE
jgi:hypothetical protein